MKIKNTNGLLLNPTKDPRAPHLFSKIPDCHYIAPFYSSKIPTIETTEEQNVVFTHPMFQFTKPARISKKTRQLKPESSHIAVFDPFEIGSGSFGSVYKILGTWKLNGDEWTYKVKQETSKYRLVKTNFLHKQSGMANLLQFLFSLNDDSDEIKRTYTQEQKLGYWVEHMSYKYPPITHGNYSFLLMRKQPGIPLRSIIDNINADPNSISILDRLKLSVNLLNALREQVTDIKIPNEQNVRSGYLVHRDLKPENILIDKDLSVKIIDYGLAIATNLPKEDECAGTLFYMDPLTFTSDSEKKEDKVTDLASIARVIAELWGDNTASFIRTESDVIRLNKKNENPGLFEGILDLQDDEHHRLQTTIHAMTSFEIKDRLSWEEILQVFSELLTTRQLKEENKKRQTAMFSINELSDKALLYALESDYALTLALAADKNYLVSLKERLGLKLFKLNERILLSLSQAGLDFTDLKVSVDFISNNHLSSDAVNLWIKLSSCVEPDALKNWIDKPIQGGELRWMKICRALFAQTKEGQQLIQSLPNKNDFKTTFCQKFLEDNQTESDDEGNIRLIYVHLRNYTLYAQSIEDIRTRLKDVALSTPLAAAILSKTQINPVDPFLFLQSQPEITPLSDGVHEFAQLAEDLELHSPKKETMPVRQQVVLALTDAFEKRKQLVGMDWNTALFDLKPMQSKLYFLNELDRTVIGFSPYCSEESLASLKTRMDGCSALAEKVDTHRVKLFRRMLSHFNAACELLSLNHNADDLLLQLHHHIEQEYVFHQRLDEYPRTQDLFDGLLRAHSHKTGRDAAYQSQFYTQMNSNGLLSESILKGIEACLNKLQAVDDKVISTLKLRQFKKEVWKYLTHSVIDKALHQTEMEKRLDSLLMNNKKDSTEQTRPLYSFFGNKRSRPASNEKGLFDLARASEKVVTEFTAN